MIDKRTIKVALMLLTIFVAGGFCGWWIGSSGEPEHKTFAPPPGRRPAMAQKEVLLNEFAREMDLTPEQRAAVDKVMTEWAKEIQRTNLEQLRAKQMLFEKFAPFVRTNLTASQKKIYDSMSDQFERRRRRAMQNL